MHRFAMTAMIVVVSCVVFAEARAESFKVNTTADTADAVPGDGDCADDADGRCSLRAAIQESNALPGADRIELGAGVFVLTREGIDEDAAASGDLDITGTVTLEGAGAQTTIIDGNAIDRVLDIRAEADAPDVKIEQLTIRNGVVEQEPFDEAGGAGLRIAAGATVELQDVDVRDNVLQLAFGGIAIDTRGCVRGNRVRIVDNVHASESGFALGAVRVGGADACLELEDAEISGNRADYAGAIAADESAPLTLRRTLISDNEAGSAGAILLNSRNTTLLENVTISGNRGNPGAILNDGGSMLTIVNSTITANGPMAGLIAIVGGIQDVHAGFGLTFFSNTVISGNGPGFLADDCDRGTSIGGGNLIGDSEDCHFDAQPSDRFDLDPGFAPLADNGGFTRTHRVGAAAIDGAQNGACPATDQRGLPRPVDGDGDQLAACDIGAVEMQGDVLYANGFD